MMRRWRNVLLIAVAVVVINLPAVAGAVENRRVDRSGVDVPARVTEHRHTGGSYFLTFTVASDTPGPGDRSFSGTARVDHRTYDAASASGRVTVRVVPGSTSDWRIDGQVTGHLGLVLTLLADLCLLVVVLLYLRFGSRSSTVLVLRADEDLERCPPRSVLERLDGRRFVVCGEVHTIEDDAVVLELADQMVRVLLDGHRNPAGYQQSVMATGTLVGRGGVGGPERLGA